MCRHLAYVGDPVFLDAVLLDPDHSLEHQSHAPRHQVYSTVNADGFGVAWYSPEVRAAPARYRTTKALWADRSFASIAGVVRTPALLAAARSATPPLPVDESANAPFVDGVWAASLNGFVTDYRGSAGIALRRLLSEERAIHLETNNDAEVICAIAFERVGAGMSPAQAAAGAVCDAMAIAPGPKNLLLTDGTVIVATALGNSLFVLSRAGLAAGGTIVSSEPLDEDPAWEAVPDGSVVVATSAGSTTTPIADVSTAAGGTP